MNRGQLCLTRSEYPITIEFPLKAMFYKIKMIILNIIIIALGKVSMTLICSVGLGL